MADDNQTIETPPPAAEAAEAAALDALKAQASEYLEGWQRARAEFANYKRRVEKEQAEAYQNATARVIGRFLDVGDDLDRALSDYAALTAAPTELGQAGAQPDAAALTKWAQGVSLIQRKLQNMLDMENVERIPAEGLAFDPNLHEAVTHEDSDSHQPGQIIGVVRQGYRIGDRVIRPALVRVAR
jgi:molecular chaperone GrpE